MLAQDQLNLLSAALRHREDAETLLGTSPDQAWHIAGFAAECVRKACLSNDVFRKALSHEMTADADRLLDLILGLDAHAVRLSVQGWAPAGSWLSHWSEAHRYDPRDTHSGNAPALVAECAALHDRTLTQLWLREGFDPGAL
jgi:type IV secretory pathway TrbD component